MKIIQDLQGNCFIIGWVFDQFVWILFDGVYFIDLKMIGKNIVIVGVVEFNNCVFNFMCNMDVFEWLIVLILNEVKVVIQGVVDQVNVF